MNSRNDAARPAHAGLSREMVGVYCAYIARESHPIFFFFLIALRLSLITVVFCKMTELIKSRVLLPTRSFPDTFKTRRESSHIRRPRDMRLPPTVVSLQNPLQGDRRFRSEIRCRRKRREIRSSDARNAHTMPAAPVTRRKTRFKIATIRT